MTGYSRDEFGPAWEDVDHNGCDTRNDVLQRDLTAITFQAGSSCVVETGTLADPYTGKSIDFTRGEGTSTAVQIDHVVALGDAWQTGAFQWSADKRLQFANDPIELLAVDGPTNEAKGDGDAATWLPPNKAFRCQYIEIQVSVKAKYGLWVTQAEHDAMARILDGCGSTNPASLPPTEAAPPTAVPIPTATSKVPPTSAPAAGNYLPGNAYNCSDFQTWAQAEAYFKAVPGDPSHLDGDHDGIPCETLPGAP